jgi:hypothetical protein
MPETGELPYDGDDDASNEVAAAREAVENYTRDLFQFLNVDVGKFNQNRHVADDLGISLSRGIPVAIFFDPQGQMIGTTNEGQLEPARRYSSRQILKFVRDIAERSQIAAPDAVY